MSRRDELQARLGSTIKLLDGIDYDAHSEESWQRFLENADKLVAIQQAGFRAGLQRAIDEMNRTIDGKPMWTTRQQLIDHLQSIHAPH